MNKREQQHWVIFDADNTLWDLESLYNRARDTYCAYVSNLLFSRDTPSEIDNVSIEAMQKHRDRQLHTTHGYSAARFARSFEDTLLFLLPFTSPAEVKHVRELALQVFAEIPENTPGLEPALLELTKKFSLGILTSGERWVQEKRLAAFRFLDRFDAVEIVEKKTEATFEKFCSSHRVEKSGSWMVGDSIKSDIIPATRIGLHAIHFEAPNWTVEHGQLPNGVSTARTMEEVLRLIRTL